MRVDEGGRRARARAAVLAHHVGVGTGDPQHLDGLEADISQQIGHGVRRTDQLLRIEARRGHARDARERHELALRGLEAPFERFDHGAGRRHGAGA
jgi:hypothetical protein